MGLAASTISSWRGGIPSCPFANPDRVLNRWAVFRESTWPCGAWRTIAGYEAIHMIRKGQACECATGAEVGLLHRFIVGMFGMEV
jgi:hypothetical protein